MKLSLQTEESKEIGLIMKSVKDVIESAYSQVIKRIEAELIRMMDPLNDSQAKIDELA